MKSLFATIAICACLCYCVNTVCKAWLATEMIKSGAVFKPIPKK